MPKSAVDGRSAAHFGVVPKWLRSGSIVMSWAAGRALATMVSISAAVAASNMTDDAGGGAELSVHSKL